MWILPSRNRADRVAQMFDDAPPVTRGVVAVDDDQLDQYSGCRLPLGWSLDVSPRCQYVAKHNYVFSKFPDERWYGSLSDDMVPVTHDWDTLLIERAGRRGIAYANDLYTRRSGAFVVGGDLVRAMGFIFPPVFVHYFGDTTMELVVREFGLAGLQEDIVVEHRHYGNKKSPGEFDKTSKGRPRLGDERIIWNEWLTSSWPSVKERISAVFAAA